METIGTESTAFLDWFSTYGQVGYVVLQILYWAVVGWAALYAARQAKRFVDFKLGVVGKASATAELAVEEFVD